MSQTVDIEKTVERQARNLWPAFIAVCLAIIAILQLPAIYLSLKTTFALVDDYGLTLSEYMFNSDPRRFRPVWRLFAYGSFYIFGDNYTLHHLSRLLMKLCIAAFTLLSMPRIKGSEKSFWLSGLLFLFLFLFFPNAPEARLAPAELVQVLFFSAQSYLLIKLLSAPRISPVVYMALLVSYAGMMGAKETSVTFGFVTLLFLLLFVKRWKQVLLTIPFAFALAYLCFRIVTIQKGGDYGTAPITVDHVIKNFIHYFQTVFFWDTSVVLAVFFLACVSILGTLTIRDILFRMRSSRISLLEAVRQEPRNWISLYFLTNFALCFAFTCLVWERVLRYAYPAGFLLLVIAALAVGRLLDFLFETHEVHDDVVHSKNRGKIALATAAVLMIGVYYAGANYYNFLGQYAVQYMVRKNEKAVLNEARQLIETGKRPCLVGEGELAYHVHFYFKEFLPRYEGREKVEMLWLSEAEFDQRIKDPANEINTKDWFFISKLRQPHPAGFNVQEFLIFPFQNTQFISRVRKVSAIFQGKEYPFYHQDAGTGDEMWAIYQKSF